MGNRVGRPRSRVDNQEWIAVFARMSAENRAWALDVLEGIDTGLQAADEPIRPKETRADRPFQIGLGTLSKMDTSGGISGSDGPASLGSPRHE